MIDPSKPIYISGPMTGVSEHNFPLFHDTAGRLRSMGYVVVNPAELDGGAIGLAWEYYLARDLKALLNGCGVVVVLPGWQKSRGARLEVYVARQLGLPIVDALTLEPWGVHPSDWSGRIVGLWGAATVGKDTLQSAMGWPRAAFADALKEDLAPLFQQLKLEMANAEHKKIARDLLVEYGRLGRKVDPDYWIKRLYLPPGQVCITDVRYLNEMKWIWGKGGIVFEVVRPGVTPANAEEERSFKEIRDYAQANDIVIPVIHNNVEGDVSEPAKDLQFSILMHFSE